MTGVAAILRYPMEGLYDIGESSDEDSEDERVRKALAAKNGDTVSDSAESSA